MDDAALETWIAAYLRRRRRLDLLEGILSIPGAVLVVALLGLLAALPGLRYRPLDLRFALRVAVGVAVLSAVLYPFLRRRVEPLSEYPAGDGRVPVRTPARTLGDGLRGRLAMERPMLVLSYVLEVLFAGPRLLELGIRRIARARRLRRLDVAAAAAVLSDLLAHDHRRAFADLEGAHPDLEVERVARQLRDVEGVLQLRSEPPGLALRSDLRRDLACALGRPDRETV
jgi:hypothetical protein